MAVFDHFQRGGDGVDIGCHAYHVDDALGTRLDVAPEVGSSHVRHDGDFQVGVVFANDGADVLVVAEFPLAELVGGEDVLRRLVAEFHVVHARLDVGEIQRADEFVVKIEIVHQTAVPDGRVQHLDVGSVGDKITSSVHCCFSSSLDK